MNSKGADLLYIDYFVSPLPLAAVFLMALNDHVLKYSYPSLITGKLSDFLGLFFFPLLLGALFSLFQNYVRKSNPVWKLTSQRLLMCMLISSSIFLLVKLHLPIRDLAYEIFRFFGMRIQIIQDSTDLVALFANIPCYFFGKKYFTTT